MTQSSLLWHFLKTENLHSMPSASFFVVLFHVIADGRFLVLRYVLMQVWACVNDITCIRQVTLEVICNALLVD